MEINISIEQEREPVAVMRLRGEINASNFMEIVDKARELYDNPARSLVIDLGEVTGISSAGQVAIHKIALIYSGAAHKVEEGENPDFTHSSNARKRVKLLDPRPEVEKTIENAGLKLFFKVFSDLESAIRSF